MRMSPVRRLVMDMSRQLGAFRLAGHITRAGLRILCYHATSLQHEHEFLPKLFMSASTFEDRVAYLARQKFPVLGLGEAVERLSQGTLPPRATVITIDDGFFGTYRMAWPILQRFGFPFTVYVTSYYCVKANPVFGLVVQYLFWRTSRAWVDLTGVGASPAGEVSLAEPTTRARVVDELIEYGEKRCDEEGRVELARELAERLAVDYGVIAKSRMLSLMTLEEVREMAAAGVDIQSHTHRHVFPADDEKLARQELSDNRRFLEGVTKRPLEHFCYPDGRWSARQWPWLEADGMKSATTCEPGLNFRDAQVLALKRFLDGENISPVTFESEMSGYSYLLRRLRDISHA